jgi:pimeloyl-ACP methyl ester carboxylesterase
LADGFRDLGVRVIGVDRPGYGNSSPLPERIVADWPADVAALADHLGIERFAVMGLSSGGPYTVACASLLGDRVVAAGVIAGVTDMGWADAYDNFAADEAELMRIGDAAKALAWCEERYGPNGEHFFDHTGDLAPADEAVLADEVILTNLSLSFSEAFRPGIGGFSLDITVQARPWTFDASAITAPTNVYHGEADTLVPVAHGRHTASLIPNAQLHTFPEDGHLSMINRVPGVCSDLKAMF